MAVYHLKVLDRRWSLVHAATGRVLSHFASLRQALPQSSAEVERRNGCLVVYRRDGSIAEWRRLAVSPASASLP